MSLTLQFFDLELVKNTIKKLEERHKDLCDKSKHIRNDFDVAQRMCLLEQEINDLYDIVSHLSSSSPRSKIFLDIF